MTDESAVATAAIAAMNTGNLAGLVFDVDKVPGDRASGDLPPTYVTVSVSREQAPGPARAGRDAASGWLIDAEVVAQTTSNVRDVNDWVSAALEGICLTVNGVRTTPLRSAGSQAATKGDAVGSPAQGLSSWTCSL
ncbi:hypothetical protein ACFVJS_03805 [Nocardioides sp. NPDC057772]|uniref:hypothetical protein n=1 Tax=Nocardioides sp. NPDC057772 TaxID=3346245 RepID=UPI00366A9751